MSKFGGPYKEAAKLLTPLLTNQSKSLKTLAFGKGKTVSKSAYATVCKTLECKAIIDEILARSTPSKQKQKSNHGSFKSLIFDKGNNSDGIKDHGLAYILLYELLFGKYKSIRGGGRAKKIIMLYESELRQTHKEVIKSCDLNENIIIKRKPFPRYARINTLQINDVASVIESLGKEFEGECSFYADEHVPNLLVFPPGTDLHAHQLVKNGSLVLQDKSSCFSALALARGSDEFLSNTGDYLDACAAPGNKTTHLACLCSQNLLAKEETSQKVVITALDRDSSRIKILKSRVELLAPGNSDKSSVVIQPLHADFLTTRPDDERFDNLRGILVDPSCSGSGIVSQPDRIVNASDESNRIESLSNFQITALKHAMSFPQVERIVYSTCSVHDLENEHVVATCLREMAQDEQSKWKLVSPLSLKHWKRRGKVVAGLTSEQAKCLIRCDALQGDETNGFFVAYFERNKKCSQKCHSFNISNIQSLTDLGVAIYSNQFKSKITATFDHTDEVFPKKEPPKNVNKDTEAKEKGVSSKKAKKLEWKKKQAAQKADRLNRIKLKDISKKEK